LINEQGFREYHPERQHPLIQGQTCTQANQKNVKKGYPFLTVLHFQKEHSKDVGAKPSKSVENSKNKIFFGSTGL
jgi:hypothetical protein